ncbi:family 2 glycosyl transferase [Calothrix sp. NIES-4071]|nr:family 2 glycosyl transferase [Calothrix sp. NIES-4071]BAZ56268.1 family 2 glycosyl transferase [Calothrix sp. NIES-4105]
MLEHINSKPLVSCIIIFFNAKKENFFEEAIESIFAQTYHNWELLLADDGSTDSSTAIALQYAQRYPEKVRYVEHEGHQNRGMSATRNLGIRHAQGEYIALLDADDIWLPQKLEKQVAILSAQPEAAMVYGSTRMWYSWTGNPLDTQRDFQRLLGVQPDTIVKPPTMVKLFLQGKAETPGTCSVLMRRSLFKDVGGFEESFRGMFEDQAFFYKTCLHKTVFVESGCWDRYRQHLDSCCYVAQVEGKYDPLKPNLGNSIFLNWLEKHFCEQRIKDKDVWQAFNKAMLPYRHPKLYYLSKTIEFQFQNCKGYMKAVVKSITKHTLPAPIRGWLKAQLLGSKYDPAVGKVRLGNLRRVTPVSRVFGFDRGLPIDRYYVENFLANQATDIQGQVLEIGDNFYTKKFGGQRVTKSDVLHVVEGNPDATIVGDLSNAEHIPSNSFDCLVLTQTLHLIYDIKDAVKTIYRILKPGGVALITVPGISQIAIDEWKDYWCWSLTTLSARRLFEESFPKENVQVEAYGNVLAATAFLQGLATEELQKQELDYRDPYYQVLLTVRVMKPEVKL